MMDLIKKTIQGLTFMNNETLEKDDAAKIELNNTSSTELSVPAGIDFWEYQNNPKRLD